MFPIASRKKKFVNIWNFFLFLQYPLEMGYFQASGGWDIKLFIKAFVFPAKAHWLPYASSKLDGYMIMLNTQTDSFLDTYSHMFCWFPQYAGYIWLVIQIYYSYHTQLASSYILVRSLFCNLQVSYIPSVSLESTIN